MSSDRGPARTGPQITTNQPEGTLAAPSLEADLLARAAEERRIADLAAIDREVRSYRRKCLGLEPWSMFEYPPSLRIGVEASHD
jgi:hypothetical protein